MYKNLILAGYYYFDNMELFGQCVISSLIYIGKKKIYFFIFFVVWRTLEKQSIKKIVIEQSKQIRWVFYCSIFYHDSLSNAERVKRFQFISYSNKILRDIFLNNGYDVIFYSNKDPSGLTLYASKTNEQ